MGQHAPRDGQFPVREAFDAERTPQKLILHDPNTPLRLRASLLHRRKLARPQPRRELSARLCDDQPLDVIISISR